MPQSFNCVSCSKRFSTSKALSCHIANKQQCRRNWHKFLANLTPRTPSPLAYQHGPSDEINLSVDEDGNDVDGAFDEPDSDDSLADVSEEEMIPVPPEVIDMEVQLMDWTLEHRLDSVNQSTPVASVLPGAGATTESAAPSTYEYIYPGAGSITGRERPPFEKSDSQQERHKNNPYFPFSGFEDWELAAWLHGSGLPMSQIDKFLHMDHVCIAHCAFK
jgi:hypothetical protein